MMSTEVMPQAAGAGSAPAPDTHGGSGPGTRGAGGRGGGGPGTPAARDPDQDRRFRPRTVTGQAVFILLGSAAAAFGLAWLVYERILPLTGGLGFWLLWYVLLLAVYAGASAAAGGRRAVSDHLAGMVASTVGLLIIAIVLEQIGYTVVRGEAALKHANFFTRTMSTTGPLDPITSGGVLHAMVGSVEQVGIATVIAVPLGFLAALFMSEVGGRMARPVRTLVEAMTSLPEIIAGLFIFALFILTFGLRQDGFAAGLALTVMMVPFVARSAEVMLRLVPQNLREASYALGSSQWRTVWNVVLPTARSGLTTAVVLGMARAIGETAPVLLTSGFSPYMNANPFSGWQTSLPLFIYESVREPQYTEIQRAFGAALVLILLILVLFTIARMAGGSAPGEISRRQRRRMARDQARWRARDRAADALGSAHAGDEPEEPSHAAS
jgi:phosphate transport system permease protein